MGKDIGFNNNIADDGFFISIGVDPLRVSGNKLLANIFEITFLTNINEALLSNGYGGNGINTVGIGYDANDTQSLSALVKIAIDNTVSVMIPDQAQYGNLIDPTEKLLSASIDSVEKDGDRVFVKINVTPEAFDDPTDDTIIVALPL